MKQMFVILGLLMAAGIMGAACGDDSTTTGPTPLPSIVDPEIISSDLRINRTEWGYHYIGWKFTIKSPDPYDSARVEIRWYDAEGYQIDCDTWYGRLRQGTHTYSEETPVEVNIWARVVRREVELVYWY